MVVAILLDYNSEALSNPNMRYSAWYWRLIALLVGFSFSFAIAYSRLFLGVHSLNQILFGALLGFWCAFTFHFIYRDPLIKLANDIILMKDTRRSYLFFLSFGFIVAIYVLQIVNY